MIFDYFFFLDFAELICKPSSAPGIGSTIDLNFKRFSDQDLVRLGKVDLQLPKLFPPLPSCTTELLCRKGFFHTGTKGELFKLDFPLCDRYKQSF